MKKRFLTAILFLSCSLLANAQEPKWHAEAIIYQIYPLSYQDSDGDGLGDLKGIIARLPYLKTLGINTIWLSPVYPSPWQDHGYDISNYKAIHPRLGTMQDMDSLLSEAKKLEIRIVMDLVMNHTSEQHPWFQQSITDSANGNFRSMYVWKEGKKKPTNWKSMVGGSGWHYNKTANAWYWASFLPFQPDLNYHNQAVKDSLFSVMDFWIARGVSGFRLDIFNCLAEDSLFRNNPASARMLPTEDNPNGFFQKPRYTQNTAATFAFAKAFRHHLDSISHNQAFSVGEVFGPPDLLRRYTENNEGLHSVFLFKTLHAGFHAKKWKKIISENETYFTQPLLPTWVLSNHDKKRFISRIQNDEQKMRCISFLQFSLRGIPFIYQGEEIGMRQQKLNPKTAHDPIVKKYGVFAARLSRLSSESMNRDECRTPMAWDDKLKNGGFSTGDTTWLPLSNELNNINVSKATKDEFSLFQQYRLMIEMRNKMPIFSQGKLDSITLKNGILRYVIRYEGMRVTCFINFSKRKKKVLKKVDVRYLDGLIVGDPETDEDSNIFLSPHNFMAIKE